MKDNYQYMASRELKVFFKQISEQYGKVPASFKEHAFVKGKEKIYMISRDVDKIDLSQVRINNIGLYIAEVKKEQLRLSIEGAQLIGKVATKNVYEMDDEQLKKWFKGEDIPVKEEYEGFAILKHGEDIVGSGKYKEGEILNFVPKIRRLQEMH
jgi:NOL1/NOP2/fmu family ribosome biogenesis protein